MKWKWNKNNEKKKRTQKTKFIKINFKVTFRYGDWKHINTIVLLRLTFLKNAFDIVVVNTNKLFRLTEWFRSSTSTPRSVQHINKRYAYKSYI